MALGFKEKRAVQTVITQKQAEIESGDLGFSAKRAAQKELEDAFSKLNEQIDLQPDAAQQNQKLADLIAGKFNDYEPVLFLKVLKEITDEIQAVDPVKEPAIAYIELKKNSESPPKTDAVMESVQVEEIQENPVPENDNEPEEVQEAA